MAKHLLRLSWDRSTGFLRLTDEGGWLDPAALDRLQGELVRRYERLVKLDGKEVKVPGSFQNSRRPVVYRVRVQRREGDSPRCPSVLLIHDADRVQGNPRPRGAAPEWAAHLLEELDDLVPAWMFEGASRQEVAGLKGAVERLRRAIKARPRRAAELLLLGFMALAGAPPESQGGSVRWKAVRETLSARVNPAAGRAGKEIQPEQFASSENMN